MGLSLRVGKTRAVKVMAAAMDTSYVVDMDLVAVSPAAMWCVFGTDSEDRIAPYSDSPLPIGPLRANQPGSHDRVMPCSHRSRQQT